MPGGKFNMHPRSRFLFGISLLFSNTVFGQVATGSITGIVTDTTGATVPAAQIRIINEDTKAARTAFTEASGVYVVRNLPPGHYRVETSLAGFQLQAKTGLVLSIDQTLTLNFSLAPGEQKEVVSVVGRAEQLVE